MSDRCDYLEKSLSQKVNINDFTPVEAQVKNLPVELDTLHARMKQPAASMNNLTMKANDLQLESEKEKLRSEAYSKRLNILNHGIPEDSNTAWESRDSTLNLFRQFLKNGLKVDDPTELTLVDIAYIAYLNVRFSITVRKSTDQLSLNRVTAMTNTGCSATLNI